MGVGRGRQSGVWVLVKPANQNPMKTKIILSLAVGIATALVTRPIFAGVIEPHQLVITENSSTSLTVTFDGSTANIFNLTLVSPDLWSFFVTGFVFHSPNQLAWVEQPENSSLGNRVDLFTGQVIVNSDVSTFLPLLANGATVPDVGFDGNSVPVSITFNDNAGAAEALETGSTLGLLFLSLVALLSASRLRSVRLA